MRTTAAAAAWILAAGSLMAAVPAVALFMWLQKYIVNGLTQGAVKG